MNQHVFHIFDQQLCLLPERMSPAKMRTLYAGADMYSRTT